MDTRHSLPTALIDAVLQYLGSRPFVEVAQLIAAVKQEAKEVEACVCRDKATIEEVNHA